MSNLLPINLVDYQPRVTDVHLPLRPTWQCKAPDCDEPWPCPLSRAALRIQFVDDPVGLPMYLATYLAWACQDLRDARAGAVWQQILGWVR